MSEWTSVNADFIGTYGLFAGGFCFPFVVVKGIRATDTRLLNLVIVISTASCYKGSQRLSS